MTYAEDFRAAQDAMIDELGNGWVAAALAPLQAELAQTKTDLSISQNYLAAADAANTKLTTANETLTTQVRQLRATVTGYKTQITTLQARVAELEAQLIPGKRCELPIATVTALRGAWAKPGDANVRVLNEVWNTAEAGPQTLKVCDETSWFVETTQPAAHVQPDRYGSVKSYPCTQVLFPKTPLSSFRTLTSRYAHETPEGDFEWNACYDMWVGGLGSASTAEVMVWTDHTYPGSIPPANALKTATIPLDGRTYKAWTRKNSNGGDYIALVDAQSRPHGSVDLLKVFNHLIGLGWLKSTDTLAAVNYGIEISHTNKTKQIFRVNDFNLTWTTA